MRQYVARRLLLFIPTLALIAVFVFAVVRWFPGDIVLVLTRDADFSAEDVAAERARLGLDKPVVEQFAVWSLNMLKGDLGKSLYSKRPVIEEMQQRLPVTVELGAIAILFSLLIGIPVGIVSAVRQDSLPDYLARSVAIGALSVPSFWLATMTILVLSLQFQWIPPLQYVPFFENPWENLQLMLFPGLILGINMSGALMRMTRATLLEVLRQDYIRTARAKGLLDRFVLYRHALKNTLIPVMAIIGLEMAHVIGGSVVLESIFGLPGVGKFVFDVVLGRDYPAIQAANLMLALFVLGINLLIDISQAFLDPRLRHN
ncbi:MAG: ABC transporter permease [Dehalococcoidia bacterium]|nr:ABC transporter permease [Dehalococcoidia bacterium]